MPDDLYGSVTGTRLWERDALEAQQAQAQTMEILGRVAMQPAENRLRTAAAGKAEEELSREKAMSELMKIQASAATQPTSMADRVGGLAEMAMKAGLVEYGTNLADKASQIRQRDAAAISSAATARNAELEGVRKEAELTAQLLGGVHDEETWKEANLMWEIRTGTPSLYKDIPYDAAFVGRLNEAAIGAKDRAEIAIKEADKQALGEFRKARLKQHDESNRISALQADLAARREERLAKAKGPKAVGVPQEQEILQAVRVIREIYPDLSDDVSMQGLGFKYASEARELKASNPALNSDEALRQAVRAGVERGDFKNQPKTFLGIPMPGTSETVPKTEEEKKGESPEIKALPHIKNETEYNKLKPGDKYVDPDGVPRVKK